MGTARRWGIFNLVGSSGFVLQMGAVAVLTRLFDWHYGVATAVGVELAILNNFCWHCRYTWADRPAASRERLGQLWRYQMAKTLSLTANVAITAWLVTTAGLAVELANATAVVSLSLVNFFVTDRMVFRPASAWPAIQSCPAAASSDRTSACRSGLFRR